MSRRVILFDLDGTLTDPAEGILGGVTYALKQADLPIPDRETLESFIGPPLITQFQKICGVPPETAARLVAAYREYFVPRGMRENRVYDGILPLLCALRDAGHTLAVATSKPEPFAKEILEIFGLRDKFDYVCGSSLDETRTEKAQVIAYALSQIGVLPQEAIMVGDRRYDVEGAAENGLPCVGVLYGYGSRQELEEAGASALAESVEALLPLLI